MTTPQASMGPKPISFTTYIWQKCKSQPLVPFGVLATCGALGGATWSLRNGNRKRLQYYLRMRVVAQGLTVLAMVIYGSVAITREQQQAHYIKTQKILGDIPADTPVPASSGRIGTPTPDFDGRIHRATLPPTTDPGFDSDSGSTSVGEAPSAGKDGKEGTGEAYPRPLSERMKVSDFAKRLREAEKLTKEDEEAAKRSGKA